MNNVFHRSLREDIMHFMFGKKQKNSIDNTFWALKNISCSLYHGEAIGLYGPNGAGKSTILKLIAGITYPTQGNITINGRIAPLIEIGAGFHPDLTGRENIFMNGAILGMKISEIKNKLEQIVDFSELDSFIDMPVKKYSSGMYLRLAFSIAIHCNADIYLIDEILAVGDEVFQKKCLKKLCRMKMAGKTMIVISHDKESMKKVVDKIYYIKKGELV